jgi:hypothetical protein
MKTFDIFPHKMGYTHRTTLGGAVSLGFGIVMAVVFILIMVQNGGMYHELLKFEATPHFESIATPYLWVEDVLSQQKVPYDSEMQKYLTISVKTWANDKQREVEGTKCGDKVCFFGIQSKVESFAIEIV